MLALEPKDRGEAPARGDGETEPFMAKSATENSAFTEQLMEEVCDRENLERPWKRVKRNKGSPGVDGMTIDDAKAFLRQHWPNIRSQLLDGNYSAAGSQQLRNDFEEVRSEREMSGHTSRLSEFIPQEFRIRGASLVVFRPFLEGCFHEDCRSNSSNPIFIQLSEFPRILICAHMKWIRIWRD
jgi:hypothetical protein